MRKTGLLDEVAEQRTYMKEGGLKAKDPYEMWTERYKPQTIYELIGNTAVVDQLYEWLKDWDDVCINGNKKQVKFRPGMAWQDQPNINARAALISGPPGIGKTSAARIVCKQLGFEVLEQNASDIRSKLALELGIKDLSTNQSLNYFSVSGRLKEQQNTN